jgi:hypothetical protein
MPELLTARETAAILRMTYHSFLHAYQAMLPWHKVGGKLLFERADVQEYIRHQRRVMTHV